MAEALRGPESVLWAIERDPHLRSTVTALAVLDRRPPDADLHAAFERAVAGYPRLRQRIDDPGLPGLPRRWVDTEVDLGYHVRRLALPEGAGDDGLLRLLEPFAMAAFDPARPLWEATLVEGLEGGRAALAIKFHHALADGVGGFGLARRLFDDAATDEPPRRSERRPWWSDAAALTRGVLAAAADPAGAVSTAARRTRTALRLLAPTGPRCSPVLAGNGITWRFGEFWVELSAMRRTASALGVSVNDVFLTAVTGGLQRYHEHKGTTIERLRITLPVNLRRSDDEDGGNHFTPLRFVVPAGIPDLQERAAAIAHLARPRHRDPGLSVSDALAEVLARLPAPATTALMGMMLKNVDLVVSNVPGPDEPLRMAGATVERITAFGPPSGAAANVTLVSHAGCCTIGIVADTAAVDDPDALVACLRAAFDEVLAVG